MKRQKGPVSSVLCLGCAILLSACGASGSSTSRAASSYTVQYYDDSATPLRVGYSYIAPIKKNSSGVAYGDGSNIGHYDKDYDGGKAYDFLSRSGKALTKVGNHWTFNYWADEQGNPFDLTKVSGDCKVYAAFKESAYTYSILYYNDDLVKDVNHTETAKTLDSQPSYPTGYASYQQINYGYSGATPLVTPGGFWGYDFSNPTDPNHPDFYLKGDTAKKAISSTWTLTYGIGAPSSGSVGASGTLYADTTLNDAHNTNPTYPLYLSNGSEWLSLGKLSEGVSIPLYAFYNKTEHSFSVTFYDQDPKNASAQQLGTTSLAVPFQQKFVLNADGTNVTASYGTSSLTFLSGKTKWKGYFKGCEKVYDATGKSINRYLGGAVDSYQIMADAVYFPED